jgi:hypothetical protein
MLMRGARCAVRGGLGLAAPLAVSAAVLRSEGADAVMEAVWCKSLPAPRLCAELGEAAYDAVLHEYKRSWRVDLARETYEPLSAVGLAAGVSCATWRFYGGRRHRLSFQFVASDPCVSCQAG